MNIQQVKQHFDLKPSPKPWKEFVFSGRLFTITMGNEGWASLTFNMNMQTSYIHFGKVETIDGLMFKRIILWKLMINWGKIDQEPIKVCYNSFNNNSEGN